MTKLFTSLIVVISTINFNYAQVGIGTEAPEAMLDVAGDMRIRILETGSQEAAADSIMVANGTGIMHKVSATDVLEGALVSFVKGTGSGNISLLNLSILSGNWRQIRFTSKEFDLNNDFNTTNSIYTAPRNGIYEVYVQYEMNSILNASDIGVGIFKQVGSATPVLLSEETHLNVTLNIVLTEVQVSPVRKTQTLVQLNEGDKLIFAAFSPLLSLTLIGGPSTFFTVKQLR